MTATINGPRVQPPGAITHWFDIVQDEEGRIVSITPSMEAAQFFHAVQNIVFNLSRSGPTASRPMSDLENRYIGEPFFDTSLGLPVFLKVASTTNTWVKADGTVA